MSVFLISAKITYRILGVGWQNVYMGTWVGGVGAEACTCRDMGGGWVGGRACHRDMLMQRSLMQRSLIIKGVS